MTEMKSVAVVKSVMLSRPFNCCMAMVIAAPAMKPTMAACDRNSVIKPNLQHLPDRHLENMGEINKP